MNADLQTGLIVAGFSALLAMIGTIFWFLVNRWLKASASAMIELSAKVLQNSKKVEDMSSGLDLRFQGLFAKITDEQKSMELRFNESFKAMEARIYGQNERIHENGDAILKMRGDIYKEFMSAADIKAVLSELKANVTTDLEKVGRQLERLTDKLDNLGTFQANRQSNA